jgi:hypothetical protein
MIDTSLITLNRRQNGQFIVVRENLTSLSDGEKETWLDFAPSLFYEREHHTYRDCIPAGDIVQCLIRAIDERCLSSDQQRKLSQWKVKLNRTNGAIDDIFDETDPCIISALMWSWLKLLKVRHGPTLER